MQVKIFRSYDERALEEEMNDFLINYYTHQIIKIDYKVILGHYDNLNDREHYIFTAIVHYIDDIEEEDSVPGGGALETAQRKGVIIQDNQGAEPV